MSDTRENPCIDGIVYWEEEVKFSRGGYSVEISKDGVMQVTKDGENLCLDPDAKTLVRLLGMRILHLKNEVTHWEDKYQDEVWHSMGEDL
ncbi:MAG: chemokine [Caudoviricetes sp.]|nr:MAG: chemokine [Caudoviricetes sp.]